MDSKFSRLIILAAVCFVSASMASAQVTTGTIIGTVTDPSGAAVAGAAVTVTEVSKGTVFTRKTDETGSFTVPFLVPGSYKVTIEASGFKKAEQSGITLQVDQRARVDVTLQVGNVTETVEVTAAAPLVQSTSAETGQVIEQRAVQELPLNGRNFAQLVYLAPGVTPGQAGENLSGASTFNPRAASNYNPLGQRANANGWLVDGIDNNEYTFNTVIVQPSLESVREFKVLTGSFSSEFGRGAGVVSVSTRSGTNDYHGTAFWFHRNIVFDARGYFQSPQALPKKLPFRRHQMGGAFSGPVIKNKLFFFADYAGQREVRGLDYLNTVPTDKVRAGDFSDFRNSSGGVIPVYNPFTTRANPSGSGFIRDQFPGNIIPASLIGTVARNVASLYPRPNLTGQNAGNANNYQSAPNRVIDDNQYTVRGDWQPTTKDSMFFRFAQQWFDLDAPQGQAACCLPTQPDSASKFDLGPWVAGIQNTRLRTHGGAFNWSRVWTPALVGEFRAGWARTNPSTVQSDFGTQAAASLGIQNVNVTDNATGLPNINVNDYTGLSGGPAFLPARPKQVNYQVDYNLYWTKSNHNLKFGAHIVRRDVSPFTNGDTRGSFNFNRTLVANPQSPGGTGSGFATLLLGMIQSGSRGILLNTPGLRAWENAFFIQDDWKVSRRLTVNVGVRYEIFHPETEGYDRLTSFDMKTLMFAYANEGGYSRTLRNTDYNNWGPRFGFAFDMFGDNKTILRGGYGRSFFPEPVSASSMLTQGVPWLNSESYSFGDFVADQSVYPRIERPFGPLTPLKPTSTAEINTRRPTVRGYSFNNPTQNAQTWSLTLQRQLGKDWMFEGGYVGSRGLNLLLNYNHNEVRIGTGSVEDRRPYQALRSIPNITIFEPMAMSVYHGMTLKAQRQFTSGFSLLGVYTYGKSLDTSGSVASGGGNTGGPLTVTCIQCYRGPSGFDVKHRLVVNGLYDLPWGKGRKYNIENAFVDAVLGGWQIGGIVTGTTGRPFNVGLQNGVNNGAPSWPDRIADGRIDNADPWYWFDATAFRAPAPNTAYGNVARGVFYSPGVLNIDSSVTKTFNITEKIKFVFRWEAFNLTNTPYFGFPNASIGSPTVGRITSLVGDNRSMQFAGRINF